MWQTILHVLGIDDANGKPYLFYSGFLGNMTIVATGFMAIRNMGCHQKRCWRVGRHRLDGTPYRLCSRHHPSVPDLGPDAQDLKEQL